MNESVLKWAYKFRNVAKIVDELFICNFSPKVVAQMNSCPLFVVQIIYYSFEDSLDRKRRLRLTHKKNVED